MAKLTLIAAVLLVAALSEAALAYRTTITTTVFEEENPRGMEQCRETLEMEQMSHCQMYMSRGRPYEVGLRSMVNQEEQHLRDCCNQLENISEECRCDAIRMVVRQQQHQQEKMQEMMRMARELPRRCHMERPRECQIRAVFV